jgi:hypothetical protein
MFDGWTMDYCCLVSKHEIILESDEKKGLSLETFSLDPGKIFKNGKIVA